MSVESRTLLSRWQDQRNGNVSFLLIFSLCQEKKKLKGGTVTEKKKERIKLEDELVAIVPLIVLKRNKKALFC